MSASISLPRHPIVSEQEWIVARRQLLAKEKELTRQQERIAAARRELPWIKVEKQYSFDTPNGHVSLADLFDRSRCRTCRASACSTRTRTATSI
jgi:predicted dithiol-disulfide oxidoreductase (DUF899 family)